MTKVIERRVKNEYSLVQKLVLWACGAGGAVLGSKYSKLRKGASNVDR